jgi:hypothetical protein
VPGSSRYIADAICSRELRGRIVIILYFELIYPYLPTVSCSLSPPNSSLFRFMVLFFVFAALGFKLRALHLLRGDLPFDPHRQSILLWLFWRWGVS